MISIVKDLRPRFGSARDQGARPTCLSFATSDLHASHRQTAFVPLSVEYLYYMAVKRSAAPPSPAGVSVLTISQALELDGQPIESDWPYLPALPADLTAWTPPTTCTVHKRKLDHKSFTAEAIVKSLDQECPCLLVIKISEAFHRPDKDGFVVPSSTDRDTGSHAVIAVAHGRQNSDQIFLVRNSWGTDWGLDGYGWLFADYLTSRTLTFSTVS